MLELHISFSWFLRTWDCWDWGLAFSFALLLGITVVVVDARSRRHRRCRLLEAVPRPGPPLVEVRRESPPSLRRGCTRSGDPPPPRPTAACKG